MEQDAPAPAPHSRPRSSASRRMSYPTERWSCWAPTIFCALRTRARAGRPIGEPFLQAFSSNFGGMTYSVETKTFFIWHADCGSAVLPDAIMSAGFDYTL